MNRTTAFLTTLLLGLGSLGLAQDLPRAKPKDIGLSSERLARITTTMDADVAAGRIPGAVAMVVRRGKVAYLEARGMADREAGRPMKPDTIFRIYSMSKPITSVALMMLYEEGKFRLKEPVSKYIPELGNLKVLVENPGDGGHRLVDSKRDMTVQDLLRHTAGLTYGFFGKSAVDQKYMDAGLLRTDRDLAGMVTKLGRLPLKHQPGSRYEYSVSVDVIGRLVEILSGISFDQYLQQRIFTPLRMVDTAFYVPESKHSRFAQVYAPDKKGGIQPPNERQARQFLAKGTFFSGGGGLVSTASDYARFCQLMLNGGELDGALLLSRKTVDLMRIDHLGDIPGFRPGYGFGLGFAVLTDLAQAAWPTSVGEYYWGGAAGTRFLIDPEEEMIAIYMVQIMPHDGLEYGNRFKLLAYQAIVD